MGTSYLMIEKTPIVRQVGQIAKCASLGASHAISQMRQCREAASSMVLGAGFSDATRDV
jgi:hypothetical protein